MWWTLVFSGWLGCAPAETAGSCPDPLVADVQACVDDWLADPDNALSEEELIVACADAEPLADAWDAWCASEDADPANCALPYEQAWTELSEPCAQAVRDARAD